MQTLVAQAIIAEMAEEYNALVDRYKQLDPRWPQDDREAVMIEQACAAFKTSMHIVARHAGIKLEWKPTYEETQHAHHQAFLTP